MKTEGLIMCKLLRKLRCTHAGGVTDITLSNVAAGAVILSDSRKPATKVDDLLRVCD